MLTCVSTAFGHTERCYQNSFIVPTYEDRDKWKYFPIQCSPFFARAKRFGSFPGFAHLSFWLETLSMKMGVEEWRSGNEKRKNPVPVLFCAARISLGLIWDRTLALAVTGWPLTTWATALPI
jgi:hypothetical protein